MEQNSRLVYSTDGGRPLPDDGVVRIARDKKGRGGKTATIITGLPGSEADLDVFLKRLKSSLGTGGTREDRSLIIQGDQRERLMAELTAQGYKPKLAGG